MRGAFIRTWWRYKYLPLNNYAYWGHLLGWIQMVLSTGIFIMLFVIGPANGQFNPYYIIVPVLVGYGQNLRYLTFRRRDESLRSQVFTWLLSPVASLWAFFVLRGVRWYAMSTCLKTGWGTREDVEIFLEGT
jgi:hyaluronan synthase